jgi:hypothetical protein
MSHPTAAVSLLNWDLKTELREGCCERWGRCGEAPSPALVPSGHQSVLPVRHEFPHRGLLHVCLTWGCTLVPGHLVPSR